MHQMVAEQARATALAVVKEEYTIDECYLYRLGFKKQETLSGEDESVYRYFNPFASGNGVELHFLKEHGIVSIEEFWLTSPEGGLQLAHPIVGQFTIHVAGDLQFLFSKNVRLNYIFNVAHRRV